MRWRKELIKLCASVLCGVLVTAILLTAWSHEEDEALSLLLEGPLDAADPRLLQHVRDRYLVPPSTAPYNMREDHNLPADSAYLSFHNSTLGWQKLHRLVLALFGDRPAGFFVEAGALDGEYLSNTLSLERHKGWTGLLVEPDGDMFAELLKKHRRAWASHSCLATRSFPSKKTLVKMVSSVQSNHPQNPTGYRAHNTLVGSIFARLGRPVGYQTYERVQCLPLQTLLLALGVTQVDFLSLDIEGVEDEVARAFFGGGVTVDVWLVEHHNPYSTIDTPHDQFIQMFEEQGYSLYTIISELQPFNYVFIRRDSELHDTALSNRPSEFELKQ